VRRIDAAVSRAADGALAITYAITGDVERVLVLPPGDPRGADPLWRHTCCEAFLRRDGSPAYHEFNFALSGQWAAYAFEDYRKGSPFADEPLRPLITVRATAGKLELDAVIQLALLSPPHAGAKLALALCAVVEDTEGELSYWALRHPPGEPDFHHPDGFALKLSLIPDPSPEGRTER
jgi:hypothetical protein